MSRISLYQLFRVSEKGDADDWLHHRINNAVFKFQRYTANTNFMTRDLIIMNTWLRPSSVFKEFQENFAFLFAVIQRSYHMTAEVNSL